MMLAENKGKGTPVHDIVPPVTPVVGPLQLNRRLSILSLCNVSLTAYYQKLLEDSDENLRVAAVCALLELGKLGMSDWPMAVELSTWGAVRTRAFTFFMNLHEYGLADQVRQKRVSELNEILEMRMRAGLENDLENLQKAEQLLFLADGTITHLGHARISAEHRLGWKGAIQIAVQALLAQPASPEGPYFLLQTLLDANQFEWLENALGAFSSARVYPVEVALYSAAGMVAKGDHKGALKLLQAVQLNGLHSRLQVLALKTRAEALERANEYEQAYAAYVRLNAVEKRPDLSAAKFKEGIMKRAAYEFEPMPPDIRASTHLLMLGFPRSGTTLLENALASHSKIETFEEMPALTSARQLLEREAVNGREIRQTTGVAARGRYYAELDLRRRKPEAVISIDKMPIYSAEAHLLSKLFPEKRYLFSLRNPFDVVLSCFKQFFTPNEAMENFRTLSGACELYAFAMRNWFEVFDSQSQKVHYVRYEDLVTQFVVVTAAVCDFLGLEREASMDDFASHAERRAARTPSYQMVRSGLSAGVQSSWRNYKRHFSKRDLTLLNPWAEKFGYDPID